MLETVALKDHKKNFLNTPKIGLVKPAKKYSAEPSNLFQIE